MRIFTVIILAIILALVLAFSMFGFLASYELTTPLARLPWQAAYAFLGLSSAAAIGQSIRRALRRDEVHGPSK